MSEELADIKERVQRLEDRQEGALKDRVRLSDDIHTLHKRQEEYRKEQKTEAHEELEIAIGEISARLAKLEKKFRWLVDQLPALGEPGGLREDQ